MLSAPEFEVFNYINNTNLSNRQKDKIETYENEAAIKFSIKYL